MVLPPEPTLVPLPEPVAVAVDPVAAPVALTPAVLEPLDEPLVVPENTPEVALFLEPQAPRPSAPNPMQSAKCPNGDW